MATGDKELPQEGPIHRPMARMAGCAAKARDAAIWARIATYSHSFTNA